MMAVRCSKKGKKAIPIHVWALLGAAGKGWVAAEDASLA